MSARISRSWLALATRNSSVPFLYQTRTLTAAYLSPPFRHSQQQQQQHYSTSSDANEQEHETAESAQDDKPARPVRRSFLRKKAAAVTQQHQQQAPTKPASQKPVTMTSTEKQIFGNLLEQLGTERRQQSQTESTPSTTSSSSSTESKPTLRDEEMDEMAQISAIFDSVLQDMKEKRQRSAARTERQESELAMRETNTAIEEKLQTGEYTDDEIAEMISSKQISMDRAIEAVIMRESVSIEAALWDAIDNRRGDTGIWEVCKERIFNILRHLDEEKKGLLGVKDDTTTSESPLTIPPSVPTEPVVTELYPKMLLVAFKLLNLHYPESHLISQFRATIKSMGRASAVLGGSTALYNEFIYFYWRGCHDLPGVVSLLRDMEVTGVEPNRRTCGLLHSIKNQRDHDLRNHWRRAKAEGKPQGKSNREPWWDLAPNRKAVKELFGDEGWVKKLEGRVKEMERARDY
ncbi:hypothetical protein AbraIFM66951_002486 [Aspergillus brasiliensis]|uniref:Mtf2-like C-terminal domain-containing protein n=1 Tax=Aspergillus brasiliensis TaxID=319629 RepID=A0A9W6DMV9_9EURO|nr:hypothetical protein AbraCBS73388_006731 [Aspergillus brasiliensis]GKZ49780.1 hypothetical protein AbraIFM66951_002486 [Aspergillus brasiliensis]